MKSRFMTFVLGAVVLAAPAFAQTTQLPAPSPIEKQLAARASHVTEITLDKKTLAFASRVMNDKEKDEAARQLIEGLEGIYVREYEFDKEDQFTVEQTEQLRKYFETSEWSTLVRERDPKGGESTDVMVKVEKGETHGFFILTVEPKELTIVMILGPIRMEDLGKLKSIGALGFPTGNVEIITKTKNKPDNKQ